jgi:hypothetical protein
MSKTKADQCGTEFLNVDLDIISKTPLDPIVDAFRKKMFLLYYGRWGRRYSANFEWGGYPVNASADVLIKKLVGAVERLPRGTRRLWNGADAREFNIGIESAVESKRFELRLRPATLADVRRVNGTIVVTIYAPSRLTATVPARRSKRKKATGPRVTRRR